MIQEKLDRTILDLENLSDLLKKEQCEFLSNHESLIDALREVIERLQTLKIF